MYECDKCQKKFCNKGDYSRHMNRKTACDKIKPDEYICDRCGYSTKVKSNLNKHMKRLIPCVVKDNVIVLQDIEKRLDNNDISVEELKNLCHKYGNNSININNTKHINNGTIINGGTNTINFIINPFGKENLSHIDNKKARKILNNGLLAVSKYIEYVHQDLDVPQNHNMYISGWNSRSSINVFNGKKWVVVDKDDVIPQVIDNCMDFINDKIEELDESNPEDEKILRMANRLKNAYDNDDVSKLRCVAKEIQKTLYNNKDVVKETIKKQKINI